MSTSFSPVVFLHLEPPNGMGRKELFTHVEDFLGAYSWWCKCHLHCIRGYELGNSHEHAIVQVPKIEEKRFFDRYWRFDVKQHWRWKHQIDLFDNTRLVNAYGYIQKHELVSPDQSPELFCPRHQHQCRKGNCKYQPR